MRISLELVVVAIIILVVAIVVLTIFGGGIGQFGTATDARANCLNQGKWSCETSGTMPAGWDTVPIFKPGDDPTKWQTCKGLTGYTAKDACTSTYNKDKGMIYTWNIK